jgi:transcription termination factor Rho
MFVLDRDALEGSPLADLHAIASELSLDGYRRLRKADLIDAIIARQGGGGSSAPAEAETEGDEQDAEPAVEAADQDVEPGADAEESDKPSPRRRRGRRGGRGRSGGREEGDTDESDGSEAGTDAGTETTAAKPEAQRPSARDRRQPAEAEPEQEDELVDGEVELLPNGSGFVRVNPPEPSDDDVYISAAQVKRCELVSGDRIAGPRRAPRRSERFASLVRIDTINGRPASEVSEGARFDDLPAAFPDERVKLGSEDPTVNAIEWLTPIGKGSRVTITGSARAGKTEALRRLVQALAGHDDVQVSVALAGVRPEEISEWASGPIEPVGPLSFAASPEAQAHAIELVIDRARRTASRGGDAVVAIDTLDGIPPHAARKLTAAARNIAGGGSLTVIATASAPVGGETTVIALDATLTATGRFPALDIVASGTLRPELLVGEAGASAIARAREAAG